MKFERARHVPRLDHYSNYKPYLRKDFLYRCAYCERPEPLLGGEEGFEIDHFRPIAKFRYLENVYENLYYSCARCNRRKGKKWPTEEDETRQRRFSDPCAEDLYSAHCCELLTGYLESITESGRFTIDAIWLNRDELINWRIRRVRARDRLAKLAELHEYLEELVTAELNSSKLSEMQQHQATIIAEMHEIRELYLL